MISKKLILSRMKSIRQTVQISNAQKLIAASRIGKARRMLAQSAPYHDHIREVICGVLAAAPETASRYIERTPCEYSRQGLLVLSSDTGLAGGYNTNLLKFADQECDKQPVSRLIVQGRVGRAFFARVNRAMDDTLALASETPTMFTARQTAEYIMDLFERREVDCFDIIYTHYTSAIRLNPVRVRLFPLSPDVFGEAAPLKPNMMFEPSAEAVLLNLISKYLKGFLYGCFIHAWTSELASRITAMDSAIRNGKEMFEHLSLAYNRARQAAITQEITEIVAGAAAMVEEG